MEFHQVLSILPAPADSNSTDAVQPIGAQRELVSAIAKVNQSELLGEDEEMTFQMDREARVPVIRIVDRKTREVVQQIPPEYVLNVAKALGELS